MSYYAMPCQDDLWEALEEYPEARRNLLEKGKQILMKVCSRLWVFGGPHLPTMTQLLTSFQDNMIDEEKAKAEEAAQDDMEQKLERLEGNLGSIR